MRTRIDVSMLILLLAAGCGSGDIPTPVPSNTPTPSAQDNQPAGRTDPATPVEPASSESERDPLPPDESASDEKSTELPKVAGNRDVVDDSAVSLPPSRADAEPRLPSDEMPLDATQLVAKLAVADDRDVVTRQLVAKGSNAVEPLLGALQSDNWEIRASAIFCLGQLGRAGKPAIPKLTEVAKSDEVAAVRDAAAFALDALEGQSSQPESSQP